jgi:hypothetical protein
LWSIIRVNVSTRKAKSAIPRISSTSIPRPKPDNESLSSSSGILSSLVSTTDIGELIMDAVSDNGGVESLLLSLVDERVLGLEGGFCSGAAVEPGFEFNGRDAEAEVEGCVRGCDKAAEVTGDCVGYGAEAGGGAVAGEGGA